MIHLDANLLVALVSRFDVHHGTAARIISGPGPFGTSSVAWMEFLSRPVHPRDSFALKSLLNGGVAFFDETTATLAGELYHLTGSKRRTRLDTMIAATAINAGAELATVNEDDFAAFVPHGLRLVHLQ